MAIKVRPGTYKCSYCGNLFPDPVRADSCRDSHELIYVPLTKTDLNRLINFLYTKNDALLTKSLIDVLTKYLRGN